MYSSQSSLAVLMCFCLAAGPTSGWSAAPEKTTAKVHALEGDERILHALDRFTFGPRPEDLQAVRSMGLERWFDLQLHPDRIGDSALQQRLDRFPAMRASTADLLYRFPSNAVIRQAIDRKMPVPQSGLLHAVYDDQMERVCAKRQARAAKTENMAGQNNTMQTAIPGSMAASTSSQQADAPAVDPALAASLLSLPPQQRLAKLQTLPQEQLDSFLKSLKGPQRLALTADMSPEMRESASALENPDRTIVDELMAQRLTRDVYSNAQLQEVMTDFWLNHFNIFLRKNEATPYYLVSFERDAIRPHALGKFEDLLEATAHSPAMLLYLDNASSTGPDSIAADRAKINAARNPAKAAKKPEGLNENYARELMELHTVGVNGGYTQADVIQAARILTGWTIDQPQRGGQFKFEPNRHEPGPKKVMGKTFREGGEEEGRELLHFLATRPATARFIARKLAIRFVSDQPSQALVDRMSKTYLKHDGDIGAVLETLFHSPEFWAPGAYRNKVKTPIEYVASALRASNADVTNEQPLVNALRDMGMPLYGCVPPTGYKWEADDWVSTGALVNRMNFALSLASNHLNGVTVHWAPQSEATEALQPLSPETEESRLERSLFAVPVSVATRSAVLEQFEQQRSASANPVTPISTTPRNNRTNSPAAAREKQDQVLAGLLLGSPEFQRR